MSPQNQTQCTLPPLNNHLHIYLICPATDLNELESSLRQWANVAKTLPIKITVHPMLPKQPDTKCPLNLTKFEDGYFKVEPPKTPNKPEDFIPDIREPEKTAVILSPAAPIFAKTGTVQKLLKTLNLCHIAGLKRKYLNYPLWQQTFHFLKAVVIRVLFCIPTSQLSGPKSFREIFKNWLCRFIFGIRYEDPSFPFLALRASVLERCWPSSNSSFLATEIMAKANFLGYLFAEEEIWPTDHNNTSFKTFKGEDLSAWLGDFWKTCRYPCFVPKKHQTESSGEVSVL